MKIVEFIGLTALVAAEKAWISFKDRNHKKQIKDINDAWQKAKAEANMGEEIGSIFTADEKGELFKCGSDDLSKLKKFGDSDAYDENHANYRDALEYARIEIRNYQTSRLERGMMDKAVGSVAEDDPIDITLTTICALFIYCKTFDGGGEFEKQERTIKFLIYFLNKFARLGNERRPPCEAAGAYLNSALNNILQMHKNRSAYQRLQSISTVCRNIAKAGLKLAVAATYPTPEVLKCIKDCDIVKNIVVHKVFQPQRGNITQLVNIDQKNPFEPRIIALAHVLHGVDNPETIKLSKETPLLPYDEKFKKAYPHVPIIQIVHEAAVAEKNSVLKDQTDEKIQNRLYQFHQIITFSSQVNVLHKLAQLMGTHARLYGDVAIYTEDYMTEMLEIINGLVQLAKTTLQTCGELSAHINKMKRFPSVGGKHDKTIEIYSALSKEVFEEFPKIERLVRELEEIKDPLVIKKEATENEERLRQFFDRLLPLYLERRQKLIGKEEKGRNDLERKLQADEDLSPANSSKPHEPLKQPESLQPKADEDLSPVDLSKPHELLKQPESPQPIHLEREEIKEEKESKDADLEEELGEDSLLLISPQEQASMAMVKDNAIVLKEENGSIKGYQLRDNIISEIKLQLTPAQLQQLRPFPADQRNVRKITKQENALLIDSIMTQCRERLVSSELELVREKSRQKYAIGVGALGACAGGVAGAYYGQNKYAIIGGVAAGGLAGGAIGYGIGYCVVTDDPQLKSEKMKNKESEDKAHREARRADKMTEKYERLKRQLSQNPSGMFGKPGSRSVNDRRITAAASSASPS